MPKLSIAFPLHPFIVHSYVRLTFPELQTNHTALQRDNQNLINALREKNRKHAQTQELYDRLKRKEMTAATQHAAFDSADEVLQSVVRARQQDPSPSGRFSGSGGGGSPRKLSHGFGAAGGTRDAGIGRDGGGIRERGMMPPPAVPGRHGLGQGLSLGLGHAGNSLCTLTDPLHLRALRLARLLTSTGPQLATPPP